MRVVHRQIAMFAILTLLLSGCFLLNLSGFQRIVVDDLTEEIDAIFAALDADATVAVCSSEETEAGDARFDCTYIVEGDIVASTFILKSSFGLLGVIIDPMILQVPEGASDFTGTFDDGSGPQPLVITELSAFKADVNTDVAAESGMKFVVLEFPTRELGAITADDPTSGTPYAFSLEFDTGGTQLAPIEIKAMFAGNVEVNGETFYVPLLPCTTDFSTVPTFEIPASVIEQDLIPDLDALAGSVSPCDGKVYDFTVADPGAPTVVAIDVKPNSAHNPVNPASRGVIPVAVLTTSVVDGDDVDVDATTLEPSTVRFGRGEAAESDGHGHVEDIDGDGDLDLVLHFRTRDTGIRCGDTDVTLTGTTVDGIPIEGSDAIHTVAC